MIKIAICDDEPIMTSKTENLLLEIAQRKAIDMDIEVFFDGSTLNQSLLNGDDYDLIYLDIEMNKLNGVATAKLIRENDNPVLLIYISSYDRYLKDLFEVEPFRFISKPINKKIFDDIFMKAYDKIKKLDIYFSFKFNREVFRVSLKKVMYFESCKRAICIYSEDNVFHFYAKLNDVEENIKRGKSTFLRIHQSYLVNYSFIKKIGFTTIELFNGIILQISEDRQKDIRKKYCNFIGGELLG